MFRGNDMEATTKPMKAARLQDVNRALGDLVFEAPFLSVEDYGFKEFSIYPQGWGDNRTNLMSEVAKSLTTKGFVFEERIMYGEVCEIIVKGRN